MPPFLCGKVYTFVIQAMPKDNKEDIIVVRIDKAAKAQLQKLAKADDRTLSSFIRIYLMRLLEESKKKG
jgi:mRNA-degrading endonuclease RelE of RelBE toxin-antitoxin system